MAIADWWSVYPSAIVGGQTNHLAAHGASTKAKKPPTTSQGWHCRVCPPRARAPGPTSLEAVRGYAHLICAWVISLPEARAPITHVRLRRPKQVRRRQRAFLLTKRLLTLYGLACLRVMLLVAAPMRKHRVLRRVPTGCRAVLLQRVSLDERAPAERRTLRSADSRGIDGTYDAHRLATFIQMQAFVDELVDVVLDVGIAIGDPRNLGSRVLKDSDCLISMRVTVGAIRFSSAIARS